VTTLSGGQNGVGIVAGILGHGGRKVLAFGQRNRSDARPIDGGTFFELGSVGKIFTALLLADMAVHREVRLDDPVANYLPPGTKVPARNGRSITLLDLATHTSGLPFMPETAVEGADPKDALYNYLAGYNLSREPGASWDYSNLGYWLLGEALARRSGAPFTQTLTARILRPLRMARSGFRLTNAMKADLAAGHTASLEPPPPLSSVPGYAVMQAAGLGLYSNADDMLNFLSAAMGYRPTPLARALALTVNTTRPVTNTPSLQGLGWTLVGRGRDQIVFRDGGTLGYASCVAWDRAGRSGVVVLMNAVGDVSDVARHILRPDFPLAKLTPLAAHHEIVLDAATLQRYAGRYEIEGEGTFIVTLQGDHLMFEAPPAWGLPNLRMRPESRTDFFARELPLRVTFQTGANGLASGMIVYPPRGQKALLAHRSS
jgi:serine-type D-Ala-D-Ala carboxypeptidase/endopeptidase